MSDSHGFHPIRGFFHFAKTLFLFACVLIATAALVGLERGWIRYAHDSHEQKSTIEIETGKAKHAAGDAVEAAKGLLDSATKELQQPGETRDDGEVPNGAENSHRNGGSAPQ